MTLLEEKPRNKRFSTKLSKMEIRAFFTSLFRQTFSRYGIRYLFFLMKSFFSKKILFAEAVAMTVKGHHFFKITRQILKENRRKPASV